MSEGYTGNESEVASEGSRADQLLAKLWTDIRAALACGPMTANKIVDYISDTDSARSTNTTDVIAILKACPDQFAIDNRGLLGIEVPRWRLQATAQGRSTPPLLALPRHPSNTCADKASKSEDDEADTGREAGEPIADKRVLSTDRSRTVHGAGGWPVEIPMGSVWREADQEPYRVIGFLDEPDGTFSVLMGRVDMEDTIRLEWSPSTFCWSLPCDAPSGESGRKPRAGRNSRQRPRRLFG